MVVVVVVVVVGVCVHLIFDVCMCVYIVVCSVHACKMAIVVGGGLCDSCRCLSLLLLLEGCGGKWVEGIGGETTFCKPDVHFLSQTQLFPAR